MRPRLVTFDMFGTVLDWRRGIEEDCAAAGRKLAPGEFDRVVDAQGRIEQAGYASYAEIVARSLIEEIGLDPADAKAIGARAGRWPLFDDAPMLATLMRIAPVAAMTNSDRAHGEDIQARLGFRLSDWLCAGETRVYKPDTRFWDMMAARRSIPFGPDWWHVSAYADYDLAVANTLGLTTVFVARPHARPGPATRTVRGLDELVTLL